MLNTMQFIKPDLPPVNNDLPLFSDPRYIPNKIELFTNQNTGFSNSTTASIKKPVNVQDIGEYDGFNFIPTETIVQKTVNLPNTNNTKMKENLIKYALPILGGVLVISLLMKMFKSSPKSKR